MMAVMKWLRRILPVGLLTLMVLNTAFGCWCGQPHSEPAPSPVVHNVNHVSCPPGSHGQPRWAVSGKALLASRQTRGGADLEPVPRNALEERSLVRASGIRLGIFERCVLQ